jgi:hypothetical protein
MLGMTEALPRRHQKALNSYRPAYGEPSGRPEPIEVVARIEWAESGERFEPALAVNWTGQHVQVRLLDHDLAGMVVWLYARDVKRRVPVDNGDRWRG